MQEVLPTFPQNEEISKQRSIEELIPPLSKEEEVYNTHMNRMKTSNSADKLTLVCKTRGQSLMFKKLVKARKSSTAVSSPVKRRSKFMQKIRLDVSGVDENAVVEQQANEVKKATRENRK